jgi:hypothetical protein
MLSQFLVGGAASACNITIHALVMVVVIQVARALSAKTIRSPSLLLIGTKIATALILMTAHTSEVIVWAPVYFLLTLCPPALTAWVLHS